MVVFIVLSIASTLILSFRMRSIYLAIPVILVLVTTCYLHLHIRELSQVVRTYSTFYPYLSSHPQTLSRYPTPSSSVIGVDEQQLAPRLIHQIHLQEGRASVLSKHAKAIISCRTIHPDWNHTIWTDETGSDFIQQHYPSIYPHFIGYKQSIQRANILRYALLDHYGGVYLDLDVTCRHSLDDLRHVPFITPGAHPAGVNNAFILSRQGHPFLKHLLNAVPSRDLNWRLPYIENMLSTGCMFFSNMWMSYTRSGLIADDPSNAVYILADETGAIEPHMLRGVVTTPLFKHGGASSWHGWDAAAIVLIGKYYFYIAVGGLLMSVLIGWGIWRLSGRRNRRRRSSWGSMLKRAVSPVSPGGARSEKEKFLQSIKEEREEA